MRPLSPLARDILIGVQVREIMLDALEGAKGQEICTNGTNSEKPPKSEFVPTVQIARPRPVMILPREHTRLRRLLMGMIVHRTAQH